MDVITRREFARFATASALIPRRSETRSFWLFKLLNPTVLKIRPMEGSRLYCRNPVQQWTVETSAIEEVRLSSPPVSVSGPSDQAAWFTLEVPGQIHRAFCGTVDVRNSGGVLFINLTASVEVATNCVTGAEMPVAASGYHALAAQAVVSRSILVATPRPRHKGAYFCDTTHCQFLRSPSAGHATVAEAVRMTSDMILMQNGRPFPPRYSAACGGITQAGRDGGADYISVRCESCLRQGLARRGHGWGLCQEGAMALAAAGFSYRRILRAYYPNSQVSFRERWT